MVTNTLVYQLSWTRFGCIVTISISFDSDLEVQELEACYGVREKAYKITKHTKHAAFTAFTFESQIENEITPNSSPLKTP